MSKLIQIIFLLTIFFNCSSEPIEPKVQMEDNETNIILIILSATTNVYPVENFHGEFNGWFKVGRLLNYRYDLQVIINTIVSNDITNSIIVRNKINYYTNTSIETNFGGYFVATNDDDGTDRVNVSTNTIMYSNTVYYYRNLYTLSDPSTTTFHSNGVVSSGVLFTNQTINGINYFNKEIFFYDNGVVNVGFLNGSQTINGVDYDRGTFIDFHSNGFVRFGSLLSNQTINGVNYSSVTGVHFHPNGKVSTGYLDGAQTIQGKNFSNQERISFDINGIINNN